MNKANILNVLKTYTEGTSRGFTPVKSTINEVSNKFLVEAVSQSKNNAFRLDIGELVLDKCHAKVNINRHNVTALVEFLYPNANNKITVKVTVPGVDGVIEQVGLEDEEYTKNFSAYIITIVDKLIQEANEQSVKIDDSIEGLVFDETTPTASASPAAMITGNPALWESNSLDSFNELIAMVEAEDDEADAVTDDLDLGDESFNDLSDEFPDDLNVNSEDEFSADDFSAGGDDLDLGDMSLGGGSGGGSMSDSDDSVNSGGNGDTPEEYVQFADKTDWSNESLRSMQKLVAGAASQEMKKGEGVILTSNEVLNGTSGMVGDSNYEVMEKFLKVYPELDGIDIPLDLMNQIEDKLEMGDDEFDSWLQSKVSEITGTEEVNDVLNNDMFNDEFVPMGGEEAPEEKEDSFTDDNSFTSFIDQLEDDEDEDELIEKEAELEVEEKELNEFPNIG
jgi:hypothetical protein